MSLLESLIIVSEKAANVARICRQDQHLFSLLVQEKETVEANPRFVQDFKTLADVLIQETVKCDIGKQFPDIKDYIKGEENNLFSNKLGETICISVQTCATETSRMLEKILTGDKKAASLLATEVHKIISLHDVNVSNNIPDTTNLDFTSIGVWIDPIDSTAEYISGKEIESPKGIYLSGLRCTTVLIGVYDRHTGVPLAGVINQPFHEKNDNTWRGKCYWGISTSTTNISSLVPSPKRSKIICISSSEDDVIKTKLKQKGYSLVEAAGAGYKALTVIAGLADVYILSKNSTFKWDTCGPQAILRSQGGDILQFYDAILNSLNNVNYTEHLGADTSNKILQYCNVGGIIAYRDKSVLDELLEVLRSDNGINLINT